MLPSILWPSVVKETLYYFTLYLNNSNGTYTNLVYFNCCIDQLNCQYCVLLLYTLLECLQSVVYSDSFPAEIYTLTTCQ